MRIMGLQELKRNLGNLPQIHLCSIIPELAKRVSFKSVSAATKRSPKFSDNYEADTLRQAMEKYDDWEYHFIIGQVLKTFPTMKEKSLKICNARGRWA